MKSFLQFFGFDYLPAEAHETAKLFRIMAIELQSRLPRNPEATIAMRKLLEAKDCAVRSIMFKSEG